MDTSIKETTTIAILGATGHIAKNLIYYLSKEEKYNLVLFARSVSKIEHFLNDNLLMKSKFTLYNMEHFSLYSYDVIINCIGIVDSTKSKKEQQQVFTVTEKYDNLILNYLHSYSKALYINLSSGAAYSTEFDQAVDQNTKSEIEINNLLPTHSYGITKLYTEAKHRAFDNLNIVDLRVFSFFSRFIDINSKFLLTDIIQCLREDKVLRTNNINIVRDYIHPKDFIELIKLCISKQVVNDVFDVYSLGPISKFDILNYFVEEYGLKIENDNSYSLTSPSGVKNNYYSINTKSKTVLLYYPIYTSLECIKEEIRYIYNGSPNKDYKVKK
ncbi:NAD-dependent epimerase/dehydratase family protein [Paenibacillus sp. P36]|uniref:NAD-dependent epimerase/dehydratase family protein n=1 Tax=Paenibacillus sp. P36 TaxID=3342538 RepID=UPI0038B3A998